MCKKSDQRGAQNFSVLFLDEMLHHFRKRTASIITFISLSECTVTGKLKQSYEGWNPELASGSRRRHTHTHTHTHMHTHTLTHTHTQGQ